MENSGGVCKREFEYSIGRYKEVGGGEIKEEGVRTLIGRNFNARTGRAGEGIVVKETEKEIREGGNRRRQSKNTKVNKEDREG